MTRSRTSALWSHREKADHENDIGDNQKHNHQRPAVINAVGAPKGQKSRDPKESVSSLGYNEFRAATRAVKGFTQPPEEPTQSGKLAAVWA